MRTFYFVIAAVMTVVGPGSLFGQMPGATPPPKVMLGQKLFMDKNLSTPSGQSCSSCHFSTAGHTDPTHAAISEGAIASRFGNRNAPSTSYAAYSPSFRYDANLGGYIGGQFWDGRAPNLPQQSKGPFLNPLEMNMPNAAAVVTVVQASSYAGLMRAVYGDAIFDDANVAFNSIGDAIAALEMSPMMNPMNSRYDKYFLGQATLTSNQMRGLQVFQANCASCHDSTALLTKQTFTNFTYHNVGLPRNPANPFYAMPASFNPDGNNYVDLGLGGALGDANYYGQFKTPTLRNIAMSWPYGHNGSIDTLSEMIAFMANRDLEPGRWIPEYNGNLDTGLGAMSLSLQDVADVESFLGTLNDTFVPEPTTVAMLLVGAAAIVRRRRHSRPI